MRGSTKKTNQAVGKEYIRIIGLRGLPLTDSSHTDSVRRWQVLIDRKGEGTRMNFKRLQPLKWGWREGLHNEEESWSHSEGNRTVRVIQKQELSDTTYTCSCLQRMSTELGTWASGEMMGAYTRLEAEKREGSDDFEMAFVMVWVWNVSQRLLCPKFPLQYNVQKWCFAKVIGSCGFWPHQQVNPSMAS